MLLRYNASHIDHEILINQCRWLRSEYVSDITLEFDDSIPDAIVLFLAGLKPLFRNILVSCDLDCKLAPELAANLNIERRSSPARLEQYCNTADNWQDLGKSLNLQLSCQSPFDPKTVAEPLHNTSISRLCLSFPSPLDEHSDLETLAALAGNCVQLVEQLADSQISCHLSTPLPYCLFTEKQQGILARECLFHSDYRTDCPELTITSYGRFSVDSGPLQKLEVTPYEGLTIPQLKNFFAVRRQQLAFKGNALPGCTQCQLRIRKVCSAGHYYDRPDPRETGIVPMFAHSTMAQILHTPSRPHTDSKVKRARNENHLTLAGTRAHNSLQLNESALLIWKACSSADNLGMAIDILPESLRSGAHLESVYRLLDQLILGGFILLDTTPTVMGSSEDSALSYWRT